MNKAGLEFKISPFLRIELFWQDKMGAVYPSHFHDHYVIGCLLRGERIYHHSGNWGKLGQYQIMLINPGQIHRCQSHGKTSASWLALHFPVKTLCSLVKSERENTSPPFFPFPVLSDHPALEKFLAPAYSPCEKNARELIDHIWAIPAQSSSEKEESGFLQSRKNESGLLTAIRDITRQIKSEPWQNIGLDEMAHRANMGKFTFLRKFKDMMGVSPCRYLDLLRLNLVRNRLYQGQSLSQCAQIYGYYDQSHMHRQFKANFGFTPGHLQKALFLAEEEKIKIC